MKIEKCVPKPPPVTYLLELNPGELENLIQVLIQAIRSYEDERCRHQDQGYHLYPPSEKQTAAEKMLSQLRAASNS